jgi:hypothetical protein
VINNVMATVPHRLGLAKNLDFGKIVASRSRGVGDYPARVPVFLLSLGEIVASGGKGVPTPDVQPEPQVRFVGLSGVPASIISSEIRSRRT